MTPIISLRDISKKYRILPTSRSSLLKEALSFGKSKSNRDFWALRDVNLEVEPGTTLGILGRNGAGKSTLLSIISGVLQPTTGQVQVNGRLTAIFGVGAGFNPLFTGRENVMLNGLILGIEHEKMVERFDEIAAFADIGEFMEQPIKTYSSGMRSRLGFAVAVNVEPDVLVLDEALSAGDAAFKKKALQRMYDLRDSGTTVLFVSHSMGMVQRFCSEAVLLHKGGVVTSGDPEEVVDYYRELLDKSQGKSDAEGDAGTDERERHVDYTIEHEDEEDTPFDHGAPTNGARAPRTRRAAKRNVRPPTGEAMVLGAELLDWGGGPVRTVPSGSGITARVHFQYLKDEEDSALVLTLRNEAGQKVFATSTEDKGAPLGPRTLGERASVDFAFAVSLRPGSYAVDATVLSQRDGNTCLSRAEAVTTLEVGPPEDGRPVRGLVDLPTEVRILEPAERQPPA